MNYLEKNKWLRLIVKQADNVVSLLIFAAIVGVIYAVAQNMFVLFRDIAHVTTVEVLHSVAVVVILVKAYRILLFYMESHHLSVKYLVEIAIIAPSVELIFTPHNRSMELNILFAVFALANLIVYAFFYSRLCTIDEESIEEESAI